MLGGFSRHLGTSWEHLGGALGGLVDFWSNLHRLGLHFWEGFGPQKRYQNAMEKLLVFDIDFRTILQGFLSCKRRHFGRAFTSKLTHVPRERIAQKHNKICIKGRFS